MQTVVIVIHLMLVLALIGAVLLQRSEGGGFATGSTAGFLSSRGTANVLTRTTAFLAAGFFVTSLVLSIIAGMGRKPTSILTPDSAPASQQAPGTAPLAPGGAGGLLDTLRGGAPAAPPQSPSTPQAPQSR